MTFWGAVAMGLTATGRCDIRVGRPTESLESRLTAGVAHCSRLRLVPYLSGAPVFLAAHREPRESLV